MVPKSTSKIKIAAYFVSILALLSGVLAYMNTISMGFPDGHLTEFERTIKPFFISYSVLALLFGILFYGLARFSTKTYSRFVFYFSLILFALVIAGLLFLYFYANSNLNHGGGA